MVAHEKRNPAQLFCAVPTQNDLALSSLLFSDHPTQKLEYPHLQQFPKAIEMIDRLLCLFRTNSAHRSHFVFTRDRVRHFLFFFSFALPCRVASVVVFSHTG